MSKLNTFYERFIEMRFFSQARRIRAEKRSLYPVGEYLSTDSTTHERKRSSLESAHYGYHAHIYFDADTLPEAEKLALKADAELPVKVGRIHHKEVGPHPRWSCQLYFETEAANTVIPWLAHNRGELTIFFHMLSGDDYLDHTQYTFWMGEMLDLNLDFFEKIKNKA